MRYVLIISVILATVALACIFWAFYRPSAHQTTGTTAPPILQQDQRPANMPPRNAGPQSNQPLP